MSSSGEIVHNEEKCLESTGTAPGTYIYLKDCNGYGTNQKWFHHRETVSNV